MTHSRGAAPRLGEGGSSGGPGSGPPRPAPVANPTLGAGIIERAEGEFIERLVRLLDLGLSLADARPVALVAAVASVKKEPEYAQWAPRICEALHRRAGAPTMVDQFVAKGP